MGEGAALGFEGEGEPGEGFVFAAEAGIEEGDFVGCGGQCRGGDAAQGEPGARAGAERAIGGDGLRLLRVGEALAAQCGGRRRGGSRLEGGGDRCGLV